MLAIHLNIGDVVLEDGWDVDLEEMCVSRVPKATPRSAIWMDDQVVVTTRTYLTSGNVPFEKTLFTLVLAAGRKHLRLTSTSRFYRTAEQEKLVIARNHDSGSRFRVCVPRHHRQSRACDGFPPS